MNAHRCTAAHNALGVCINEVCVILVDYSKKISSYQVVQKFGDLGLGQDLGETRHVGDLAVTQQQKGNLGLGKDLGESRHVGNLVAFQPQLSNLGLGQGLGEGRQVGNLVLSQPHPPKAQVWHSTVISLRVVSDVDDSWHGHSHWSTPHPTHALLGITSSSSSLFYCLIRRASFLFFASFIY